MVLFFNKPTIFSTASGFKGVGEAGAEAVMPIEKLLNYVEEGVNNSMRKMMQEQQAQEIDYDKLAYACSRINVINKIGGERIPTNGNGGNVNGYSL